ncbi:endochitinase CHI3 [Purpureocillium lavendulum]|uniref:Endochitinase CHI3 n=1 Tax=Purpureocillium lavendulum TaxID=1247861 RepID=A0AB34FNK0_9HYPO|nr:endochitinase CHI3 [Purpureocillium lavendulum]
MLAATEALKPKSPQTRDTPASKVSRMVPSVLAKVSSAWGRLSSRPSTPEPTEAAKLRKEAARETTRLIPTSRTTPNIMAPAGRSSIDSLALRRNEGANLNKRKIQKILGGSFTPKLSSGSRKSLRTDQALDVSCGEPIEPQIPSDAEIWRMFFGTDDADDDDGQLHDDKTPSPFGSEVGFEENLEDRILHTAPTGSSTPRVGSSSPHVDSPLKSSNDSDTKSVYPSEEGSLPSDVQVKVAEVAVKLGDDEAKTTIREVDVKPSSSVKNGKATTNSQRRVMPVAHGRIEAIKQDDRQKKHPSPSKQELEVLEQALQWYLSPDEPKLDPHVN